MSFESFEDLECYKVARDLRIEVVKWAKCLGPDERYRLSDQVIRSARSITANIAEGFGRQHPKENLQFCRQARGSLTELLEHLNTALDESLLGEAEYSCFREKFNNTKKLLSGYIRYLQTLTDKDRKFQSP